MKNILKTAGMIRMQSDPDACLHNITSVQDIRSKMNEVRALQSTYRDANLYQRDWKPIHQPIDDTCLEIDGSTTIKVLQFNTLAQGLSSGPIPSPFEKNKEDGKEDGKDLLKSIYGGFTDIPNPEIALDFNLRRWRLMEVLLGTDDFDIIAMEEVDQFHGFFEPLLKIMGYEGLFMPKPHSPGVQFGWYSDGCAFFWKRDVFELIHEEKRSYNIGSQVYTIATMKHIPTGRVAVFAVTHLKAGKHAASEEIRTAQVIELLDTVEKSQKSAAYGADVALSEIPVILMGDFNSDPSEEGSCIHNIISEESNYRMNSTYGVDPPDWSLFTSWKIRGEVVHRRIIDFIFYNPNVRGITCTHTLDVPKEHELETTRLPGFKYPSDHLAIGAQFKLDK